jgi:hypothetical protein
VGADVQTKTYYTQYYFVSSTQPPSPINGVGSKVVANQYECLFNDGATFNIRFVDSKLNIGRISIVTPAVAGEFCILDTALYNDFYSNRRAVLTSGGGEGAVVAPVTEKSLKKKKKSSTVKDVKDPEKVK